MNKEQFTTRYPARRQRLDGGGRRRHADGPGPGPAASGDAGPGACPPPLVAPASGSRTSSSSWATMSAGSTSAPTTGASCPARRRTSTSWPSQGMLFTDYYAEASCTAGRANFITGEIPLRTGLTTVGQAGADVGMPAQAVTHRHRAQGAGLRHRPVRQEPPRRPEQVPADACTASTSSSATCTTSTPCRTRTGTRFPHGPDATSTARATSSIPGPPTRTTRP